MLSGRYPAPNLPLPAGEWSAETDRSGAGGGIQGIEIEGLGCSQGIVLNSDSSN